jgi:hypothetical protein
VVLQTFDRTIKEFQELEREYDRETEHRRDLQKQRQWDSYLYDKLQYYKHAYDKSKEKFVRICETPLRGKLGNK